MSETVAPSHKVELAEEEVAVDEEKAYTKIPEAEEEEVEAEANSSALRALEEDVVQPEVVSMQIQGTLDELRKPRLVEVSEQPGHRMMPTLTEVHLPDLLVQSVPSSSMLV